MRRRARGRRRGLHDRRSDYYRGASPGRDPTAEVFYEVVQKPEHVFRECWLFIYFDLAEVLNNHYGRSRSYVQVSDNIFRRCHRSV